MNAEPGPVNTVTAVVLAAGAQDALATAHGVAARALMPYKGRPLIGYVLAALAQVPEVSKVVVVGALPEGSRGQVSAHVRGGESFLESFKLGVEAAQQQASAAPLLLVTADLPWLTAAAVSDFLAQAAGSDLAYPVVRREVARAQFPQQKRTYATLKDGAFTGGNMVWLEPHILPALLPFIDNLYARRKNPFYLARLLGADLLLRLLTGQLRVAFAERRVAKILGAQVRAVITPFAGVAADVDAEEHLH